MKLQVRHCVRALIAANLALAAACSHGEEKEEGPHGFGPLPTTVVKLTEKTISDFDEYLASIASRRSITLYPQVSGYVRNLRGRPGDFVKAGTVLVEIDPGQQRGLLKSLAAGVQTRKASLDWAVQNDEGGKNLVGAGLIGDLDSRQRHSQRVSAEADVQQAEAQMQAQAQLLRFYTITAPIDGILGDVPVKIGDFVEPQSRLTSVDQNKLVEAYVYVPVGKANTITRDTSIQIVDDSGQPVCEQKPSFVSPQVNVDTQTVLVKTICPNDGRLRAAQVLKARVVWSKHPGVTVPVSAVVRQSGQYFVYVIDHGKDGAVAHQHVVDLGAIEDNDYVVLKGLAAGDEIATTNVQKIHDGAPIAPTVSGSSEVKTSAEH